MAMVAEGCIYGRFQPFHNEHLEYALAALERCSFLWIGLVDPFPTALESAPAVPRNPLTYFERQFMITRVLVAEGHEPGQFGFVPFPLATPEFLPQFLDPGITCFVANGDEASRADLHALEPHGYPVETLPAPAERIDCHALVDALARDDEAWRREVPPSVAAYLDEIDFQSRLPR